MLSATRRRVIPASLLLTGALSVGLLGAAIPAQAATLDPTAVTTPTVTTTTVQAPTAVTAPTTVSVASTTVAPAAVATVTAAQLAAMRVARTRSLAVKVAVSRVGSRYVAGASGPRRFDCSGLALYVVKKATGRSLPHYSKAQYRATKRIKKSQLRPGDLVFFFRHGAHHVGVYIGHGRMVSATNPRHGVKIDSVFSGWYGARYSGAGRLI